MGAATRSAASEQKTRNSNLTCRLIVLSPNGHWLAYVSNRSGRNEVYVVPFPDAGSALVPVSTDGGTEPVWAHSGGELFYVNGANDLVAVQVSADSSFTPDQQNVLFSVGDYTRNEAKLNTT